MFQVVNPKLIQLIITSSKNIIFKAHKCFKKLLVLNLDYSSCNVLVNITYIVHNVMHMNIFNIYIKIDKLIDMTNNDDDFFLYY